MVSQTHVQARNTDKKRRRETATKRAERSEEPARKVAKKEHVRDVDSIREQAHTYHIVTAQMPLEALSSQWSLGQNRQVDARQVEKLCDIFVEQGLKRRAKENHLLVLCRRDDVSRALQHNNGAGNSEGAPYLRDWLSVNQGRSVEIMAGQHRVKALEAYIERIGAGEEEAWWMCEFYDIDTLPLDLNLKLRANRQDPTMIDTHGQIWAQLAAAAEQDPDLLHGNSSDMLEQMTDILQLSSDAKVPITRLVTLWRSERWRDVITEWCKTSLGRATFQISTWEWMITNRMDDFWFSVFRDILFTLSQLPGDAASKVGSTDWKRLSANLPAGREDSQVHELFYPDQVPPYTEMSARRRTSFLVSLSNCEYMEVYRRILSTKQLRFPNVHRIVSLSRDEGRVLYTVMSHVVAWLNPEPTKIIDRRDNNKPPLCNDLVPALRHCSGRVVRDVEKRLGTIVSDPLRSRAPAEDAAILLQKEVIDFILERIGSFRGRDTKAYLTQLPGDTDSTAYARRFATEAWAGVASIVRGYVGNDFHPEWTASEVENPVVQCVGPVRPLCSLLKDTPDFANDVELIKKAESESFQRVLNHWLSQHYGHGISQPPTSVDVSGALPSLRPPGHDGRGREDADKPPRTTADTASDARPVAMLPLPSAGTRGMCKDANLRSGRGDQQASPSLISAGSEEAGAGPSEVTDGLESTSTLQQLQQLASKSMDRVGRSKRHKQALRARLRTA